MSAENGTGLYVGASRQAAIGNIPMPPKFATKEQEREFLKFRLAQAYRIFGKLGYDEGVAGHITVRDSIRPDCFWVNPFGKHFSLVQPDDLILVDYQGNVQAAESGPNKLLNKAAYMIHAAVHAARSDVNCAAHSHSMYGRAFSSFGKHLDMITQDACVFYQDHSVYDHYNGLVHDEEEGQHIVKALGSKKAAILKNHGILVASDNIEAAIYFFITLERACQVQLAVDAAAAGAGCKPSPIPDKYAEKTRGVVGTPYAGWFSGLPHFQRLEAEEGVSFDCERGVAVKRGDK
ncbi:arad-like aldolase/epimerase [Trametes punicea]|nr:arad-like aldolase/epimerase [Trametes punicea]